MPINDNISNFLKRYKAEKQMSITEMAEEFGIARSIIEQYLNGSGNPRADTLELLAEKCGVPAAAIISAHHQEWEQAEIMERAARLLGDLPPERQDKGIQLLLELINLFSKGDLT